MILDRRGKLVWFRPLPRGLYAYNLEVSRYHGQPVLTWWQGEIPGNGHGADGHDMIVNASYRPVADLHAGWGYSADLHEFQVTPQGTALIAVYDPIRANLSSVGGPSDGTMLDCLIQELDINTGTVLWEWHALGHVPLRASELSPQGGGTYDPFHLNSIQQLPGHRLLISLRHTSAVYEIGQRTGRIIWTLGGKDSSFRLGPGAAFGGQHDAHLGGDDLLTVFDNATLPPDEEPQSSAKELKINFQTRTVSLLATYVHSPSLLVGGEGSAQLLSDHDVFVGWGDYPNMSEYTPDGRQLFDANFPLGVTSYRAYRFAWVGRPLSRPALALTRSSTGITLYVSWNGATQVARWRVLGGSTPHRLTSLKVQRRTGFETAIALSGTPSYVGAQALDARGHVLGRSRVLPTG